MANTYTFNTELVGFVAVEKDQGKYNNRTFGYQIPEETLEQMHSDRVELLSWVKKQTKAKKPWEAVTVWDDEGTVKFFYGDGDGSRKPKPEPVFVDVHGRRLKQEQRALIKQGSKVCLTLDQKPYMLKDTNARHRKQRWGPVSKSLR